jgi:uncharacterized phage infection (PIP) family protein YhgE
MATATSEAHASVDLSELLSFNVSFKNLELVLRSVLSRLDRVEQTVVDNHAVSTAKDEALGEGLEDVKQQLQEQKDIQAALSERCAALAAEVVDVDRLTRLAGDRADDAHRRIDALDTSSSGGAKNSPAPTTLAAAAPMGKDYGEEIAALQRAVANLEETKADKKLEDEVKQLDETLSNALKRLAAVQEALNGLGGEVRANDAASKNRDDALAQRLDALQTAAPPVAAGAGRSASVSAPSMDWAQPVNNVKDAVDRLKAEQDAMSAKLAALAGLQPSSVGSNASGSGISEARFVMLEAAVGALEQRPLPKDYDQVIELLNQQVRALGNECSANSADCQRLEDKKANKDDLDDLKKAQTPVAATKSATSPVSAVPTSGSDGWVKPIATCNSRIDDLQRQIANLEGTVRGMDVHRLDRMLNGLNDDVDRLKAAIDELRHRGAPSAAPGGNATAADRAVVEHMQKQLGDVVADTAKNMDWTKGQVLEIRATIEHIHHTKADTALVANKAERDFVENSMEKLMREVEQVLNATNAGLIDTLDKSLNILRDMIDGKATKQDVVKLQSLIGDDQTTGGAGSVPEGLMGFKGYRCLGCNRTMDGMRQRPMGANFSTFMNRLPANSNSAARPVSQQQTGTGRVTVAGPSPPAGYIGNTPQSR